MIYFQDFPQRVNVHVTAEVMKISNIISIIRINVKSSYMVIDSGVLGMDIPLNCLLKFMV